MFSNQRRILPAFAAAVLMLLSLPQIGYAEDAAPAEVAIGDLPNEVAPADDEAGAGVPQPEAPAAPAPAAPAPQAEAAENPAVAAEEPVAGEDGGEPAAEPGVAPAVAEQPTPRLAAAAAADCPSTDRSDAVTGITVTPTEVEVNDVVSVNFSALLTDGGCEGDFIRIPLPPELKGLAGTFPITHADGSVIAQMVVTGDMITITFNDYLETHENVRFNGFLKARVTAVVEPGEDYDLAWNVGNEVFITPITTVPCENCQPEDIEATKFAAYEPGPPPYVRFAITTAATKAANELITITDVVGPGQELNCEALSMQVGDSVDAWGNVEWDGTFGRFTVDSCDAGQVTVSLRSAQAGQFFRLNGRSYTTAERESYTDSAEVTQAGQTTGVRATAELTDGGGDVDGNNRVPKVDIEKWSTDQDITTGDHDDDPKEIAATHAEKLTFTITNTGNEVLKDIVVSDATTAGTGSVENLRCTFPDGATPGTTWAGPFAVGASFTCTGTLSALGPDATHTNNATVTGVGRRSNTSVTDEDPWTGVTPPAPVEPPTEPKVDIEKWSTVDGPSAGDHDDDPKTVETGAEQAITFTVTNTGNEDLINIQVSDETISGNGTITGLTCDFSALGGPNSGTSWRGPFKIGESFECTGTVTALKAGQKHQDRATIVATGATSGTPVTDKDDWNSITQPDLPNTGGHPALPNTGSGAELLPVGLLGATMIGVGLQLSRRRSNVR
jgi:Bacterial Ig domain